MHIFSKKYKPINASILSEYNSVRHQNQDNSLCYAPFKSLRFSQSGNVLACCFNRGFSLGKYPENTLHEIWFGSRNSELKTYIKNKDLSLGCGECSRRIENRLFNLSGAFQYDYLSELKSGKYPAMFDFEISNICNLECVMCTGENSSSIRAKRDNLPAYKQHYDSQFVEQLKEFVPHLKEARFSGGEPFLIPIYYDIWEMLIKENPEIKISVLSNATILNERVKNLLARGNFQVSVSFDSLNKETYEKIRRNANFDEAFSNLDFFYNYSLERNTTFIINVCPQQSNWKEIPSIVRYCNEKKILLILHIVVFPPSESLWALGSVKLKEIPAYLENEKIKENSQVGSRNLASFNQFINQIRQWTTEAFIIEEKKKELYNKTENELLERLQKHIFHPTGMYSNGIAVMLNNSDFKESERKAILLNLLGLPSNLIISEINHKEPERLLQRLKMFNYKTE